MNKVHYSSKNHEWETPQDLFDRLHKIYFFDTDVCATYENAKLATFYTIEDDALNRSWKGSRCWMNPPYGREIGKWIEKAATGGGRHCCGLTSRAHRHKMVPSVYIQESGSSLPQRSIEVWWFKEFCPFSKYDCNFQ